MSTYYISPGGDNSNNGLSEKTPWQTVGKVFSQLSTIGGIPGDQYLFEGGKTFNSTDVLGVFSAINSDSRPIVISTYGSDLPATINIAAGNDIEAMIIYDCNAIIENINFTRADGYATSTKNAITITGVASSPDVTFTRTIIRNCEISGFYRGITVLSYQLSGIYENLLIKSCKIFDIKHEGIQSFVDRSLDSRFIQLTIDDCVVEQVYGDALALSSSGNLIVLGHCKNSKIKNSEGKGIAGNCFNHNGFWFYASESCTIENSEVYRIQGTGTDRGGFAIDIDSNNCKMQSCYAYDCEGEGFLLMNGKGNTLRYSGAVNCARANPGTAGIMLFGATMASTAPDLTSTMYVYSNLVVMPNVAEAAIRSYRGSDFYYLADNIIVCQNAASNAVQLNTFTTGAAQILGNDYWNTTGANTFRLGPTTYTGLAAFRTGTGYEILNGINVGLEIDPVIDTTFVSYRLRHYRPTAAALFDHEPPEIPFINYREDVQDISGFSVYGRQVGPFVLEQNLSNLTVSGGGTGDAPTEAQIYTYFTALGRPEPFKATGFSTPANITDAQTAIIARGDADWVTANVSALLTTSTYTNSLPPNFLALAIAPDGAMTAGNMRGTDGAIASLAGIATSANVTESRTAIIAGIEALPTPLDATATADAVGEALTVYTVPTLAQVQAAGFTTTRDNALLAESRRKRIDYLTSTLTLYAADNITPLQVFDLKDADGSPATSGQTAVDRVPQ